MADPQGLILTLASPSPRCQLPVILSVEAMAVPENTNTAAKIVADATCMKTPHQPICPLIDLLD
jgi:hypothetical protein